MPPTAHIAHLVPGRMRIRVPTKRHDNGYFSQLAQALLALPGVDRVEANALTASLLIHHTITPERIADFAAEQALCEVVIQGHRLVPLSAHIADRFQALDSKLSAFTEGTLDVWGTLFLVLVGLGIAQLAKGNILVPATTLLWYALGTLPLPQRILGGGGASPTVR